MPRRWVEHIHDWPSLSETEQYLLRAASVEKSAAPPAVSVQLEFTEGEQSGRTIVTVLPLPCRPSGRTIDFFRSCGHDVTVGRAIAPEDSVGKVVRAQFARDEDGQWQIVLFVRPAEGPAPPQ